MAIVSLSKVCRSKNICEVIKLHKNTQNPLWKRLVFHKSFENHHLKFAKMKKTKTKIKKEHFRQPVNGKPNLFTNWSLKILAIKRWFPFNSAKMLRGWHLVVGLPKNLQLVTDISFDSGFQKIIFLSFRLVSSAWYLRWFRQYLMK